VRALTSRGVSLVEVLVALTLSGLLASGVAGVLGHTQNFYRAATQEIDVSQSLRVAGAFLPAELRELDAADGDVVAMTPTAVTIRAARQLAALCRPPWPGDAPGSVYLTLRTPAFSELRDLNPATDSLWVFREGDPVSLEDDDWVAAAITAIEPDTCPDGGTGQRVTAFPRFASGQTLEAGQVAAGAPVLGFETVTYRLYRSSADRRWYVGMETSSDLQPVLGPVTADGLVFTYLDSTGATATQPARVRAIEFRVRARTVESIRTRDGRLDRPLDSLVAVVFLRNNPRF
jgi:prepilin-type N-terminal cleavage/methylation domain-containing protein